MHIPKTGGRYIRQNLFLYLIQDTYNEIDTKQSLFYDHNGFSFLQKNNRESCFSFTFLRNPIERVVSHYMYLDCFNYELGSIKEHKNNLLSLIEDDSYYLNNYQAKFICYNGTNAFEDIDSSYEQQFSANMASQRLASISKIMKTESLSQQIINSLYSDCMNFLGIERKRDSIPSVRFYTSNFNKNSYEVFSMLSKSEKNFIESKNYQDMEIWQATYP